LSHRNCRQLLLHFRPFYTYTFLQHGIGQIQLMYYREWLIIWYGTLIVSLILTVRYQLAEFIHVIINGENLITYINIELPFVLGITYLLSVIIKTIFISHDSTNQSTYLVVYYYYSAKFYNIGPRFTFCS
jgi:hypothetical protein